jgi:HlyD family type I secretion membrane fusion protein
MTEQRITRSGGGLPRARARFLAQAIQLEERGPAGIASATAFIIGFLLAAVIVWSAVTQVSETARATGEVIPAGLNISIQHLEGGIVERLAVRDGDAVSAGDLLLSLDPTQLLSELEQMKVREASLILETERLSALISGRSPDFGESGEKYPHLADKQRALFQAQMNSHERESAVVRSQLQQRKNELARQRNEVTSLRKELSLYEEQFKLRKQLKSEKLVARTELLSVETRLAESQRDLRRARDGVSVAASSVEETEQRLIELDARYFEELEQEAARVAAELAEVAQSLIRLQARVDRLEIYSQVEGIVQGLNINSRNAVVEPGEIIMQIVPVDDELVVEARVSPKDIGHVHAGQPADVSIDSFDAARFGTVPGQVRRLSATTYLDEQQRPYYRAEIELSRDYLGPRPDELRIIPGMTGVASIKTGAKSVLDYLLKPITRGLDVALAER